MPNVPFPQSLPLHITAPGLYCSAHEECALSVSLTSGKQPASHSPAQPSLPGLHSPFGEHLSLTRNPLSNQATHSHLPAAPLLQNTPPSHFCDVFLSTLWFANHPSLPSLIDFSGTTDVAWHFGSPWPISHKITSPLPPPFLSHAQGGEMPSCL